jgi:hypothetical protein
MLIDSRDSRIRSSNDHKKEPLVSQRLFKWAARDTIHAESGMVGRVVADK